MNRWREVAKRRNHNWLELCKSTGAISAMINDLSDNKIKDIRDWCNWLLESSHHKKGPSND